MPTPAKPSKPKLIPLTELRALCKEAGVRVDGTDIWYVHREGYYVALAMVNDKEEKHLCRQNLKAYCLGLIAMRERGEL